MIRWLYDLGFLIFGIFSLPHFLGKLEQAEDKGRLIRERFGFLPPDLNTWLGGNRPLWIHSVSVGEVLAVEKFVHLILERKPREKIVLTTVTPTGQRIAKKWEGNRLRVFYFPFDVQFAVRRFFEQLKPRILLLVETEIWPNVIGEAKRRQVPLGIINGRLSERSFKSFRRFSFIFKSILTALDFYLVQTPDDEKRWLGLGVNPEKVTVTGNMKLDAFEMNGRVEKTPGSLREKWGFQSTDQILVAGSTHPGEEEILMRIFLMLAHDGFPIKLLLAPRHIERSRQMLKLAHHEGLKAELATARGKDSSWDVLILDQLGELRGLYGLADVVFMGGSLVHHGGQNPIEPASFRKPIIHGPWVFNFKEIYRSLAEEGGSLSINNEQELAFVLKRILTSDREKEYLGNQAYVALRKLQGATERNLKWIGEKYEFNQELLQAAG